MNKLQPKRPPDMIHSPGPRNQPPTAEADEAAFAHRVLNAESQAIQRVAITPAFHAAVRLILNATTAPNPPDSTEPAPRDQPMTAHAPLGSGGGTIVVSGLGKSGLIGQKVSATLASTGTPSHFLHPTEAVHGDLGRVRRHDVVMLLSFGGNTEEVVSLATILRQDGVAVISIVGRDDCDLARLSTVTLCVGDVPEACPLNLAPTASTTAMLALGDALALCVSRRRKFGVDDFRKTHPGGLLGRRLMPVVEAMRFRVGRNLPLITQGTPVQEALRADAPDPGSRRTGAMLVVDHTGKLAGILTDADLRRLLVTIGSTALDAPIESVMTKTPRHLTDRSLVRDAVQMVREFRIDEVPVLNQQGKPLGLIDIQDLVALKVIEG